MPNMTYEEYLDNRQREYNSLPIFYAFSNKQFKEAMEARGLTEHDTDQIFALPGGMGGYYLRKDAEKIRDYFNAPDPLPDLMNDPEFATNAFFYEMCNHEYGINWEADYDVCQCFGSCEFGEEKTYLDYLREMGYDDYVVGAYCKARDEYFKLAREGEWF